MTKTPKTKKNEIFALRVTLSPEQASAVVTAIDFYMRIRMGQFSELGHIFWDRNGHDERVSERLNQIKALIYPEHPGLGASYSIASAPYKDARVSYDVLQVIRHAAAWAENPEGGMTVNFDRPSFVSDALPRPKAEVLGPLEILASLASEVDEIKKKPSRKGRKR